MPDSLLRRIVRRRLSELLKRREAAAGVDAAAALRRYAAELAAGPLVIHQQAANRQHYELPTEFFEVFLGPRLKYSACLWPPGVDDLTAAEEAMLALTCERAGLEDGMEVLDLGCGWGSLALYIAERYPGCRVTAMSNSRTQAEHIAARCARDGIAAVTPVTADIATFDPGRRFDRILSVEMLEHVRDYRELFARLRRWLAPGGASSCTSSATRSTRTRSTPTIAATGWAHASSAAARCRRTTSSSSSKTTWWPRSAGG